MNENYDENEFDQPSYKDPKSIALSALVDALSHLTFLGDDPFLRMQVYNLALVDQFLMDVEYKVLSDHIEKEKTPVEANFLSAQSQMWIFAAYELLRTWKQRVTNLMKWSETGGLEMKLEQYEKEAGYNKLGRSLRAKEIKQILSDKSKIDDLEKSLRSIHIVFGRLEAIRVYLAKHEISGKAKLTAFMPGYGRINRECGALDYQLENEYYIIGNINRRDIADEMRVIGSSEPPSNDDIKSFDLFMKGFSPDEEK